jgi:hypothetical protein
VFRAEQLGLVTEKRREAILSKMKRAETKARYISAGLRREVLSRDQGCRICGSQATLQLDHIRPIINGGDSSLGNLWTLCKKCNLKKGTRQWPTEFVQFAMTTDTLRTNLQTLPADKPILITPEGGVPILYLLRRTRTGPRKTTREYLTLLELEDLVDQAVLQSMEIYRYS